MFSLSHHPFTPAFTGFVPATDSVPPKGGDPDTDFNLDEIRALLSGHADLCTEARHDPAIRPTDLIFLAIETDGSVTPHDSATIVALHGITTSAPTLPEAAVMWIRDAAALLRASYAA